MEVVFAAIRSIRIVEPRLLTSSSEQITLLIASCLEYRGLGVFISSFKVKICCVEVLLLAFVKSNVSFPEISYMTHGFLHVLFIIFSLFS